MPIEQTTEMQTIAPGTWPITMNITFEDEAEANAVVTSAVIFLSSYHQSTLFGCNVIQIDKVWQLHAPAILFAHKGTHSVFARLLVDSPITGEKSERRTPAFQIHVKDDLQSVNWANLPEVKKV